MNVTNSQPQYLAQIMNNSDTLRGIQHASSVRELDSSNRHIQAAAVYDLATQLAQIKEDCTPQAQAKNISLTLAISDAPVAYWDMARLRNKVFHVLLKQAIRHTQTNGKITLLTEKLDNYTLSIQILCSESDVAGNLDLSEPDLADAHSQVLAHHGTMKLTRTAEQPSISFDIKLPLYALCLR